jgi:hypothetical protein
MKITIDERDGEVLFFMNSETIQEAAQILRISNSMMSPNRGRAWWSSDAISGWIKIKTKSSPTHSLESGKVSA